MDDDWETVDGVILGGSNYIMSHQERYNLLKNRKFTYFLKNRKFTCKPSFIKIDSEGKIETQIENTSIRFGNEFETMEDEKNWFENSELPDLWGL